MAIIMAIIALIINIITTMDKGKVKILIQILIITQANKRIKIL